MVLSSLFIAWSICLLIMPICDLAGLINLHFVLVSKFGLWSLIVGVGVLRRSFVNYVLPVALPIEGAVLLPWGLAVAFFFSW